MESDYASEYIEDDKEKESYEENFLSRYKFIIKIFFIGFFTFFIH